MSPILIWKLIGYLFLLFCAWNKQYSNSNCMNFPKGNDSPTPVDPKIYEFLIFFLTVQPICPYKNGIIPIEPNNG